MSTGTLSLTFYNQGGKYTPGLASGAYYPNVKVNRPVRLSVWSGSAWVFLFTGTFDSIVAAWDGGMNPVVNAAASDGFKGLNRRVSQSFYAETVLDNTGFPNLSYYPLSEPAGATTFGMGNPAVTNPPVAQLATSKYGTGTFTAGNGQGFMNGAPSATYCTFASTGTGNTQGMSAVQLAGGPVPSGIVPPAVGPWTWGCWFNIPTAPTAGNFYALMYARTAQTADPAVSSNRAYAVLAMNSSGQIFFQMLDKAGVGVTVASGTSYAGAGWHYVTACLAADQKTLSLFVDSSSASAVSATALASASYRWFVAGGLFSPWGEASWALNGSLANLELYSAVDASLGNGIRWLYGRDGFYIGSRATSDRFFAVAENYGYVNYVTLAADAGVTSQMANFDTTGNTFLNALQQCVDTEQGLMYMRGDGALIFRNRAYRVNQTSAFTLDASRQDIDSNFQVGVDDQLLFNEHAVTRPGGPDIRVRDSTTTSVADNGVYTNAAVGTGNSAKLLLLTTDNELVDYATYMVAQYGNPKPRTSQITVDLKKAPDLWTSALLVELGVRFTLNSLPVEAPTASMDFVIESVNWDFSGRSDACRLSMDTSPADTVMYMTLDDNVYGLLDQNSLFY
jgi:hypothetical protein